MDIIPDMDDLLNELEAADTAGKLKYGTNDTVLNSKMALLDASKDFNDKQGPTHFPNDGHFSTSVTVGKFHNIAGVFEKSQSNVENWGNASNGMESVVIGDDETFVQEICEDSRIILEGAQNVHATDVDAKNVLSDITSLSSSKSDDSQHCAEVKSKNDTGQAIDLSKDLNNGNSFSANADDVIHDHDCGNDHSANNSTGHWRAADENEESNCEEFSSEITNRTDVMAEQYDKMEQYLASCCGDDTFLDSEEQPNMTTDAETSSVFSSTKEIEKEIGTTSEQLGRKFISLKIAEEKPHLAGLGKATAEAVRNVIVEDIIKDTATEFDVTPYNTTEEQSADEMPNDGIADVEDLCAMSAQKSIDVCVGSSATSTECPSPPCYTVSSFMTDAEDNTAVDVVRKSDGESRGRNEDNDDKESHQVELVKNGPEAECEMPVTVIEEEQAVSVVLSTHDISHNLGVKYLTESERQLGKKKPIWIADKEALSCMICCIKFTVFVRRHHCRCCGRVLCANCTAQKAPLAYENNPKKEHRVCDPCFETLKRIEESEKNLQSSESQSKNIYVHPTGINPEGSRAAKPVLKSRGKSECPTGINDDQSSSSTYAARGGSSVKRSVTFRDGLHPGHSSDENQATAISISPSKPKKHDSKRQHMSWRLQQLHITEECVCFLPNNRIASSDTEEGTTDNQGEMQNSCFYLRSNDGAITECDNVQERIMSLKNFEPLEVMIFRNLWCIIKLCRYENRTVMCIISKGMSFVGLDEIFLAYYCDAEFAELPTDYMWRIYEIYQDALTPRNESLDEELGIRLAHNRVSTLNRTTRFSNPKDPVARDILLFRPSVQAFENLLVPSSPFLVAVFIYQSEWIWANVIPQRLLFRLGLQASFYPTIIINDFNREPVYNSIYDTSVLKMFNDFRNWRFQMPLISGSTLTVQDNSESVLIIPTWALDEIVKLIKANKNMIAWGLDYNPHADSYLICKQDDAGSFDSQIFTNGIGNRRVTGASFIIIDGALKDSEEPLAVNVLEDGMAIRFRPDVMESLIEALSVGQNFEQNSSSMKFLIKWEDPCQQLVGALVSPIDNRSLIGCYEYGLKKSRILGSSYPIPNQVYWSLRLVSVYNVAKGRFVQRIQSKVFSVSEQVAAQIAATLVPFAAALIEHDFRDIFFRIRVTAEDAEYKTQPWPGMEKEFAAWLDFLDYQVVPGLFTICSYVTVGFHAELHMALISIRPNP